MDTKAGQEPVHSRKLKARLLSAELEFPIHRILETFIDRPNRLPDPASPKHGLLRNICGKIQRSRVVRRQNGPADLRLAPIDEDTVPIDQIDIGIGFKETGDICQSAGKKHVIAIQICHESAVTCSKAGIDCVRLTAVDLTTPANSVPVVLEHLKCTVARSTAVTAHRRSMNV